jgi:hypothetical protein
MSKLQSLVRLKGLGKLKKSIHHIGFPARDLPACNIVSQPLLYCVPPPSLLSNGYWGDLSPGVKRRWSEADHCPLSNAEIKTKEPTPHSPTSIRGLVLF